LTYVPGRVDSQGQIETEDAVTKPITQHLIQKAQGPFASVYACPFCRYMERAPKHPPGRAPSGYGWRVTSILTGALVRHMKEAHPIEVTRSLEIMRETYKAGWRPDVAKNAVAQAKREMAA
jgi:hypothetical protein